VDNPHVGYVGLGGPAVEPSRRRPVQGRKPSEPRMPSKPTPARR
jgi:hypothetical protein